MKKADVYIVDKQGQVYLKNRERYALTYLRYVGDTDKQALFVAYGHNKQRRVDRMVALKYMPIENPRNYVVVHKDGDPRNCALDNLEWVSRSKALKTSYRGKKRGIRAVGSRWLATITQKGKTDYLGTYDTKNEAYEAFRKEFVKRNGEEPW